MVTSCNASLVNKDYMRIGRQPVVSSQVIVILNGCNTQLGPTGNILQSKLDIPPLNVTELSCSGHDNFGGVSRLVYGGCEKK